MKKLKSLILLAVLLITCTNSAFSQTNCALTIMSPGSCAPGGSFTIFISTTNDSTSAPIDHFEVDFAGTTGTGNNNLAGPWGTSNLTVPNNWPIGPMPITVRAYSTNGLECQATHTINCGQAPQTDVAFQFGPFSAYVNMPTEITINHTNPVGPTVLNWGDGTSSTATISQNGPLTFTHIYSAIGSYPITVSNNDGFNAANMETIQQFAIINAPDTVFANIPFNINYHLLTNNFIDPLVTWGDSTSSHMSFIDSVVTHTYTAPGTYYLTYTAPLSFLSVKDTIVAVIPTIEPVNIISPMGGEVLNAGITDTVTVSTPINGGLHYTFLDSAGVVLTTGTVNSPVSVNGNIKKYLVHFPVLYAGLTKVVATIMSNTAYGSDSSNTFTIVNRVVQGFIYYDFNSDNIFNNTDWPYYPTAFNILPGTGTLQAYLNGNYTISALQPGNVTISPVLPANFTAQPAQYVVDVTNPGTVTGYNFALQPIGNVTDFDLSVSVYRISNGIVSSAFVRVDNAGPSVSIPTTLTYLYNDAFVDVTNTNPQAIIQTPGSVSFNVPVINPGQYMVFRVYENLLVPVGTNMNESASIPTIDIQAGNNAFENVFLSTGAYDPNNIIPSPGIIYTPDNINPEPITYVINFQNTGNGEAYNVRVNDTIASNLDMATFEVLESSHNMNTIIRPGGVVDFMFPNIMLPDSNANEPASHGYIVYRIKPTGTLPLNSVVNAKVDIYFDYNPPITTNTGTTVVMDPVSVAEEADRLFSIFPNPANGMVYIQPNGSYQNDKLTLRIFSADGRLVKEEVLQPKNQYAIDISKLSNGIYNIVLSNGKTVAGQKVVKN